MNYKEYKNKLGKKLKDMTRDELNHYNRLRYKAYPHTKAAYRKKRRDEGKDLNTWGNDLYNRTASAHNNKMRQRWEAVRKSSLTTKKLADWLREQEPYCYLCGKEYLGIDHLVPLSQGGEHVVSNLRICCVSCNSIKNNLTPEELQQAIPDRVAGLEMRLMEIEQDIQHLRVMQENLASMAPSGA